MKINHNKIFSIVFALLLACGLNFAIIIQVSAKEKLITPESTGISLSATGQIEGNVLNKSNPANPDANITATPITGAILTIFAASTGRSSSSIVGHAFLTVKNVSTGGLTITVGRLSGIAVGKTVSLGTWGNTTEHKGLWYDLEEWHNYKYPNTSFPGRVSVSYLLNATQLSKLNSYIVSHDSWTLTAPCSSFAVNAWNTSVDTGYRLSAGTPSTPTNLVSNIKSTFKGQYATNAPIPYDYVVYYANGTGTPTRSSIYK